ncbi:MAG TPA: lysophospholipid acyltransferase family protein [Pyrinomonadaceae bacterium]|nr:lysophospholipid acyltransferase family protein [Pyrinomonadaceae bacterium]
MKLEIKGKIPEPPFFLVCNHLSYTDIPVLRAAANGVFVAKSDVRKWFLLGKIVADAGTVFINRQNKRDIPRAGNEIVERISNGEGVFLFPEGTSSCGKSVLPFNSSFLEFAARADLPVSYCSVSYQTEIGEITASKAVCWFDETVFMTHLFRFFILKKIYATITFGDAPVKDTNRKKLASALHEKVENLFTPLV